MKKLILATLMLLAGGVLAQPVHAEETETNETVAPTFAVEDIDSSTVKFKLGQNLILAGNNVNRSDDVKSGLMLVAGNTLSLDTNSEYGFIFGNTVSFSGRSEHDLYFAGNTITLEKSAEIGRDVYAAGNILSIYTDVAGDVSATAGTVVLRDVKISGNLNLDVENLRVEGEVAVAGTVNYNDDANVSGLNQLKSGKIDTYHIDKPDAKMIMVARIYAQIFSAAALFLVMVVIVACYGKAHDKIAEKAEPNGFGMALAAGLVALIVVPVVAIFALISLIGAPLGVIAIVLYIIALYLAKGFAGIWLGHLLLEKVFKVKGSNAYLEALLGIVLISALSLVPWVGSLVTFLSVALGLGLILNCIKPTKADKPAKKAAEA